MHSHRCEVCKELFLTCKQVQAHRLVKHNLKVCTRQYIGDTLICLVCHTDFRSRMRPIKHLSETRVRSQHRTTSCRAEFLSSNAVKVPQEIFEELEAKDKAKSREIRRSGHKHELADLPSTWLVPHILKKQRTNPLEEHSASSSAGACWVPCKRL